ALQDLPRADHVHRGADARLRRADTSGISRLGERLPPHGARAARPKPRHDADSPPRACATPRKDRPMSVYTEPVYKNAAAPVAERVADLLGRMTVDEKLGQMTQIDRRYLDDESDLATYHLGSVFSGGGSAP